jgi:hypothetical protein
MHVFVRSVILLTYFEYTLKFECLLTIQASPAQTLIYDAF